MSLYRLKYSVQDLSDGVLLRAEEQNIEYEKLFECWLENSPDVLFDEGGDTVLWIGRQETAAVGDTRKIPDLIGIDSTGDLVIVELKKGRTPREIVAQALEYSSWAASLNYEDLNDIFKSYHSKKNQDVKELKDHYNIVFNPDSENDISPKFNTGQKIFFVAEEVSPTIAQVCDYLRRFGVRVYCLEYIVQKTKAGDIFVSTERKVWPDTGSKDVAKSPESTRWGEPERVKDVIHNAVKEITGMDIKRVFSPSEVYRLLVSKYPTINKSTVNCQLIADAVNHPSRKHYPGGQRDYYFWLEKGKYRLYDPQSDGKWNQMGERIGN